LRRRNTIAQPRPAGIPGQRSVHENAPRGPRFPLAVVVAAAFSTHDVAPGLGARAPTDRIDGPIGAAGGCQGQ